MPQSSVKSFYEKAMKNRISTQENLLAPVTMDFLKVLSNFPNGIGLRAIDLGYGYGNYSIEMAQKGFQVTAVDYVKRDYFEKRLGDTVLSGKITIIERDLNIFTPEERYDVVVSKDVLHFLRKSKVEELINVLVRQTNKRGWHYLVIFTDIRRKSGDGNEILIENEAQLTIEDLLNLINFNYHNWKVDIKVEPYQEKDRSGKEDYFKANKVTLIANNQ